NQSGITTLRGSMSLTGPVVFEMLTGNTISNLATLSGSGSLIKTGPGTVVLAGSGSYGGDTTVRDGTLIVAGSASINGSALVDISGATGILDVIGVGGTLTRGSGQTLQGFGTLRGSVTVNSGGTLSPGGSIGTLTVTNAVTLNAGSTTFMEVDAGLNTSDRLVV